MLATAWELLPDWRFGQLLFNIFVQIKSEGKDPFYVEDDAMIKYIEEYIDTLLEFKPLSELLKKG
jgi:hypothetical protein